MKKILLFLLLLGLSFLSFSSALNSYHSIYYYKAVSAGTTYTTGIVIPSNYVDCLRFGGSAYMNCTIDGVSISSLQNNDLYCYYNTGDSSVVLDVSCSNTSSNNGSQVFNNLISIPSCPTCLPQYTSQECQFEYNLIPISDIDSNYCVENDLCTFTGSYSNLFINDIWHESKPFIYVNIPEEISWDYTGNNSSFTLDVGGYNTDSDYIAGIITTQKFTPDSSDFQKIITDVLPLFVPGLVIILFIYYIFRLIKKLF